LQFSIDAQTGKTVGKVVDGSTQEVIRQISSEEVLPYLKIWTNCKASCWRARDCSQARFMPSLLRTLGNLLGRALSVGNFPAGVI